MKIDFLRPDSADISQIDALAKLGANKTDIASVLGITDVQLSKWQGKSKAVAEILKPKALPEFTMNHPEYAPMVEEAFVCGTKRFYRFKEEYRLPAGRYKYYYAFLREVDLRVSLDVLKQYVTAFKDILNGGNKGKGISLGSLWELVLNLETRTKLAFEPAGVRNLASVCYFDETEDLTTYDTAYGKQKIKLWDDHGVHDFFLTRPIDELLNLRGTSHESLLEYLNQTEEIIQDLNSGLSKVSEENS